MPHDWQWVLGYRGLRLRPGIARCTAVGRLALLSGFYCRHLDSDNSLVFAVFTRSRQRGGAIRNVAQHYVRGISSGSHYREILMPCLRSIGPVTDPRLRRARLRYGECGNRLSHSSTIGG